MMRFRAAGLVAFCLATVASVPALAADHAGPVNVTGGTIVGNVEGSGPGALNVYLGVPFAAPPVGPLRWRAPQAVQPWSGIRQATQFSSACAQTAEWITTPKSEDCLYLNVWAPRQARKLPVLVWIHGGGMYGGTAAQEVYNGSNLAGHGAVVVSLNYRLGIFGFFAHPELSAESPTHTSGNQGIQDQIAALRWVKRNIAAFGGDPTRVTIVGESSGGESVALLVASPLAKGLFQRAISESGNDAMPISPAENEEFGRKAAEAKGVAAVQALGGGKLAALRALSVADVQKVPYTPIPHVDGDVIREDMTTMYRNRRHNDVPLLVGWTAEEGKDLAGEVIGTHSFTAASHRALVTKLLGHAPSDAVMARYPGATDAQALASINQLTNDWWGWRMLHWAALQKTYGKSKTYAYYFAHRPAEPLTPCNYGCGAGHGVEIQYVFDNLGNARPWTRQDRQLATRMADTWVQFARTGNPNGKGLPAWQVYDGSNATVLPIASEAELKAFPLPDFSLFPSVGAGQ